MKEIQPYLNFDGNCREAMTFYKECLGADLFVMPSTSEPFGITPLEAIGFGAPALVSKQSGVSEIIDNVLKVDFWDVNEMANQMTAVVQNDALRDELYRNSHKEWQKLGWGEAAKVMQDIYSEHTAGAKA